MVLGFLRRLLSGPRSSGQSQSVNRGVDTGPPRPMGEFLEDGRYVPHPEELARAKPIPPVGEWWDPQSVGLSEEEAGWPIVASREWRPRRVESDGLRLRDPVWLPGFKHAFHGMVWTDRGVYLVDGLTYAILYKATGRRTAEEIVEEILEEYSDYDEHLKKLLEKGPEAWSREERDYVHGFISALYFQMALLRKEGLLE